jgi:hypothetical protein
VGWCSMVSIATIPLAGWSEVQILVGTSYFSLLQNVQTGSGAHPAFYFRGMVPPHQGLNQGVGIRCSVPIRTGAGSHPASSTMGTSFLSRGKAARAGLS